MFVKTLTISSLFFILPGLYAIYQHQYVISGSMFLLVLLSISNHQFHLFQRVDKTYIRSLTILLTFDSLRHYYILPPLCSITAGLLYKYKRNVWYHVCMHAVGCLGFMLYIQQENNNTRSIHL